MKKNIIIISGLVVTVLSASYCGIWFAKTNQFKKQISNWVDEHKDHFTVGEILTSGFPLAQKITLKDVKVTLSEGNSIALKNIEAKASAFSSSYEIKVLEPIVVEDAERNISLIVEANPDSKILVERIKESIEIKYFISGYKVSDQKTKKVIITAENKDYESSLFISDKVLKYKHKDGGSKIMDEKNNVVFSSASSFYDISSVVDENKKIAIKFDANLQDFENHAMPFFLKLPTEEQNLNSTTTESVSGKNNFVASGEIDLTPNSDELINMLPAEQMAKIPEESKAMFQKKPSPYSAALNLKNFEFSNSLYKTTLNGTINTYLEDKFPSGLLILKIENFDAIIKEFSDFSKKISATNPDKFASIEKAIRKTSELAKNLAKKNSQSTETAPIFEIKREKNGGFNVTINGVPFFEIMDQFVKSDAAAQSQNAPMPK